MTNSRSIRSLTFVVKSIVVIFLCFGFTRESAAVYTFKFFQVFHHVVNDFLVRQNWTRCLQNEFRANYFLLHF